MTDDTILPDHMIPSCSASGRELRAQLWPVERKVRDVPDIKPRFSIGSNWRAIAYILVAAFCCVSAALAGLTSQETLGSIFHDVDRQIEKALPG